MNSITTGAPFSSSPRVSIRPRCHGPVGYSDARNRMPSICSRPASTRRCSSTSSLTVDPGSSTSCPPASRRNNISSATSAPSFDPCKEANRTNTLDIPPAGRSDHSARRGEARRGDAQAGVSMGALLDTPPEPHTVRRPGRADPHRGAAADQDRQRRCRQRGGRRRPRRLEAPGGPHDPLIRHTRRPHTPHAGRAHLRSPLPGYRVRLTRPDPDSH